MLKKEEKNREHWAVLTVEKILEKYPDMEEYVCASGISPSGRVHFGNFRDVITPMAVVIELKKRGKKAKLIYSWDDFDRFRKVPKGVDESFEQYLGRPLTVVPAPNGKDKSYARQFEKEMEESMTEMGFEIEYKYQTEKYKNGDYDESIIYALQNRKKIAKILLSFMSEKGKQNRNLDEEKYIEEYYPISIYSRFSGKDNTKILDYDGDRQITYKCFDSGETETIDIIKDRIGGLGWKIDWPMRWKYEGVIFEPGGKDHSALNGSFDASSKIAREIFNIEPPIYQAYDFVSIRGVNGKMSGSSGNSVTPSQLLEIYTPELLKWMYFKNDPLKEFSLAFDSEVYRQYAEFDREILKYKNEIDEMNNFDKTSLELSGIIKENIPEKESIPFRQAVGFGQIVQWNKEKLMVILKSLGFDYDEKSIDIRLEKAKNWLETYNKDEIISLLDEKNEEFISTMSDDDKKNILKLKDELKDFEGKSIEELNTVVYSIVKDESLEMKEQIKLQKDFFKVVYNLLIGKKAGPRLATFLWALEDKNKILSLLNVE